MPWKKPNLSNLLFTELLDEGGADSTMNKKARFWKDDKVVELKGKIDK